MTPNTLLKKWRHEIYLAQDAHFQSARFYGRLHKRFGIPSVVLSSITATTVFSVLQNDVGLSGKIFVCLVSISSAAFTAIHTFLNAAERSQKHKDAAVKYQNVVLTIEAFNVQGRKAPSSDDIDNIRKEINLATYSSPNLSRKIIEKINYKSAASGSQMFDNSEQYRFGLQGRQWMSFEEMEMEMLKEMHGDYNRQAHRMWSMYGQPKEGETALTLILEGEQQQKAPV